MTSINDFLLTIKISSLLSSYRKTGGADRRGDVIVFAEVVIPFFGNFTRCFDISLSPPVKLPQFPPYSLENTLMNSIIVDPYIVLLAMIWLLPYYCRLVVVVVVACIVGRQEILLAIYFSESFRVLVRSDPPRSLKCHKCQDRGTHARPPAAAA